MDQRPLSESAADRLDSRKKERREKLTTPPDTAIPVVGEFRKKKKTDVELPPSLRSQNPSAFIRNRFSHLGESELPLSQRGRQDYKSPRAEAIKAKSKHREKLAEQLKEQENAARARKPNDTSTSENTDSPFGLSVAPTLGIQKKEHAADLLEDLSKRSESTKQRNSLKPTPTRGSRQFSFQSLQHRHGSTRSIATNNSSPREPNEWVQSSTFVPEDKIELSSRERINEEFGADELKMDSDVDDNSSIGSPNTPLLDLGGEMSPMSENSFHNQATLFRAELEKGSFREESPSPRSHSTSWKKGTFWLSGGIGLGIEPEVKLRAVSQLDEIGRDEDNFRVGSPRRSSTTVPRKVRGRLSIGDELYMGVPLSKKIEMRMQLEEEELNMLREEENESDVEDGPQEEEEINSFGWKLPSQHRSFKRSTTEEGGAYQRWENHLAFAEKLRKNGNIRGALMHTIAACQLSGNMLHTVLKRAQLLGMIGLWDQVFFDTSYIIRTVKMKLDSSRATTESRITIREPREKVSIIEYQVYHSARFLRSQAFMKLAIPDFRAALADLDAIISSKPPDGFRGYQFSKTQARVLLEKAKIKFYYGVHGDKSMAEKKRILEWALDDLDDAKSAVREFGDEFEERASQNSLFEILYEFRARVNYEMLKSTKNNSQSALEAYTSDVEEAYRYGLLKPKLVQQMTDVCIEARQEQEGLDHSHTIQYLLEKALSSEGSNRESMDGDESAAADTDESHAITNEEKKGNTFGRGGLGMLRRNAVKGGSNPTSPTRPNGKPLLLTKGSRRFGARKNRLVQRNGEPGQAEERIKEMMSLKFHILLEQGRLQACGGDILKAVLCLEDALSLQPNNVICRCFLAELQIQNGQISEALATLNKAQATWQQPSEATTPQYTCEYATFLQVRIHASLRAGYTAEAYQDLRALARFPDGEDCTITEERQSYARLSLAKIQLENFNEPMSALTVLEELLKFFPKESNLRKTALHLRALCYLKLEDFQHARREFSNLIHLWPEESSFYILRAWTNLKLKKSSLILADLAHASALNHHKQIQEARRKNQDRQQQIEEQEEQEKGRSSENIRKARLVLLMNSSPRNALNMFVECHERNPSQTTFTHIVETIRQVVRRENSDVAHFKPTLRLLGTALMQKEGKKWESTLAVAECFHMLGDFDGAIECYTYVLQQKGMKSKENVERRSRVLCLRGMCKVQQGVVAGALKKQFEAFESDVPPGKRGRKNKSKRKHHQTDGVLGGLAQPFLEAFKDLDESGMENPNSLYLKAELLLLCRQRRMAIDILRDAASLSPKLGAIYVKIGVALASVGIYGEAIVAFDKCIELKPDSKQAWYNRGWAYLRSGRLKHAVEAFSSVLSTHVDSWESLFCRGQAYVLLHNYEAAIEDLSRLCRENAIQLTSNGMKDSDPVQIKNAVRVLLAHCFLQVGRFEKANIAATNLSGPFHTNAVLASIRLNLLGSALLGKVAMSCGNFGSFGVSQQTRRVAPTTTDMATLNDCIRHLRQSVHLDPTNLCARINLGSALLLQGRPELARKTFDATISLARDSPASAFETSSKFLSTRSRYHSLAHATAGYALTHLYEDQPFQSYLTIASLNNLRLTPHEHRNGESDQPKEEDLKVQGVKQSKTRLSPCDIARSQRDVALCWAVTLHALGNVREAYEKYSGVMGKLPAWLKPQGELLLASACLRLRRPIEAQELCELVLKHHPDHVVAALNLSVSLSMQESFTCASETLKALGNAADTQFHVLFNRAALAALLGDAISCQKDCDKGLVIDPSSAAFLLLRACASLMLGRTDYALRDFEAVLEDDALVDSLRIESAALSSAL